MYGLSSSTKESIGHAISKMFDSLAFKLLGRIPKLKDKTHLLTEESKLTLTHIFIQALGGREPNLVERDVLRSILNSSWGYIESLKNKTASNLMEAIDALVKESKAKNQLVTMDLVGLILLQEMDKARNHLKLIAEAETTKTRNVGYAMEISRSAKENGISDPTVAFIIVKDNRVCTECLKIHMLPDKITPRVWRFSDLSHAWHKRGEDRPSTCSLHPLCRCTMIQVYPGWGFKDGFLTFIGPNHDEYKKQREAA